METISWILGCTNMASSLVFSAIGHHSKKLDDVGRTSMNRACNMHQIASLGFLLLAHQGAPVIPFSMLCVATVLFPGVVYYQTLSGTKSVLGSLVPKGGMLHIVFWLVLACYFKP